MSDDRDVSQATPAPAGRVVRVAPDQRPPTAFARAAATICARTAATRAPRPSAWRVASARARTGFRSIASTGACSRCSTTPGRCFATTGCGLTLLSAANLISNQVIGAALGAGIAGVSSGKFSPGALVLFGVTFVVQLVLGLAFSLATYTWSLRAIDRQPLEVGATDRCAAAFAAGAVGDGDDDGAGAGCGRRRRGGRCGGGRRHGPGRRSPRSAHAQGSC